MEVLAAGNQPVSWALTEGVVADSQMVQVARCQGRSETRFLLSERQVQSLVNAMALTPSSSPDDFADERKCALDAPALHC